MSYDASEYTFSELLMSGMPLDSPLTSLAYLVALAESPQNEILNLSRAGYVLTRLFGLEHHVRNATELISIWSEERLPKGLYPQTPVMVTHEWSPIAEMLERGWDPIVLQRQRKLSSCAAGIWEPKIIGQPDRGEWCDTQEGLFWHVMSKVAEKGKSRGQFICVVAKPGWSYEHCVGTPTNISLEEAQKADRVIWQRTPTPDAR
jgi:hypothetical protein